MFEARTMMAMAMMPGICARVMVTPVLPRLRGLDSRQTGMARRISPACPADKSNADRVFDDLGPLEELEIVIRHHGQPKRPVTGLPDGKPLEVVVSPRGAGQKGFTINRSRTGQIEPAHPAEESETAEPAFKHVKPSVRPDIGSHWQVTVTARNRHRLAPSPHRAMAEHRKWMLQPARDFAHCET